MSITGSESSLPFVSFFDANQVVSTSESKFCENLCISDLVQSVSEMRGSASRFFNVMDAIETSIFNA